jgi:hypothetical protein
LAIKPPTKYDVDRLPPELLAGIGKIIAWWGYLQFQMGVIIRAATEIDVGVGYLLTIDPDLSRLCDAAVKIANSDRLMAESKLAQDLRKLAGDIKAKAGDRNDFAHGVFGPGKTNPGVFVRHHFKSGRRQEEVITVESLEQRWREARAFWMRAQVIKRKLEVFNAQKRNELKAH